MKIFLIIIIYVISKLFKNSFLWKIFLLSYYILLIIKSDKWIIYLYINYYIVWIVWIVRIVHKLNFTKMCQIILIESVKKKIKLKILWDKTTKVVDDYDFSSLA